jgi:hypothetical protein
MDSLLAGTMGTTVKDSLCLHAVTDDPTAAVRAGWRQCLNGTFKAIEDMGLTTHPHFKTLIVHVTAYFTAFIIPLLIHYLPLSLNLSILTCGLSLPDILMSGAGLSRRGFGFLRDIGAIFRFEAIANHMDGLRTKLFDQIFGILCISYEFAVLDMSIFLADQPLDRCPGTTGALSAHPLKMTGVPYILRSKGFKVASLADLHMIIISLPTTARLFASTAG